MSFPGFAVGQQLGEQNLAHQRALQDQQRQFDNGIDMGIISNPDPSVPQETRDAAKARIDARYPTPMHLPQMLADIIHFRNRQQQAGAGYAAPPQPGQTVPIPQSATASQPPPAAAGPVAKPSAAAAPSTSTPPAAQAAPSTPTPAPATPPPPSAAAAPQQAPAPAPASLDQIRRVGMAQTPQEALSMIPSLPTPAASGPLAGYSSQKQQDTYYNEREQALQFQRNMALYGERGAIQLEIADRKLQGLLAGKPPRPVGDFMTIPHLMDQMTQDPDMIVAGPDGHTWTAQQLQQLPPGTLAHMYMKGNQVVVGFGDPKSKMWNIGGVDFEVPTYGPVNSGTATPLGTATSALPKAHQVPGVNPGEKINLVSGPTATPGMNASPPPEASPAPTPPVPGPPAGATAAPPGTTPQTPHASAGTASAAPPKMAPSPLAPPKLPPSPSAKAVVDKLNQNRSQSKQIPQPAGDAMPPAFAPGTLLQQARPAMPVVSAMSVVASNVFGAHGDKPLWENAWMYDNPNLRQALNNALTLNALHIPGTEENPSLMESLKTAVGATQWSQEQINQAAVQARQEVERLGGPEALKQFAREAAMQEDLSALRAATKASAAQGSLNLAVRAAPVYNISSSQDFRNQLGTMLSTAVSSMHGYPGINPAYVNWWDKGVNAAKNGPTGSPSTFDWNSAPMHGVGKKGGGGV